MADGKPFSAWLSGDLLKKAEARTAAIAGGNNSRYVRDLIEKDLAGAGPSRDTEHALYELAAAFHPVIADDIRAAFPPGKGQQLVIARMLEALLKASGDPTFDGRKPFELVDPKRIAAWEAESEERIQKIAERVSLLQLQGRATRAPESRPSKSYDFGGTFFPPPHAIEKHSTDPQANEDTGRVVIGPKQNPRPKRARKPASGTGQPKLQPHDETQAG